MVGCGDSGPTVVPATGIVNYNGQPLAGARVMFHPQDGGARSSHGTTGADGRFELSTFGTNDGALLGKQTVTVAKVDQPGGGATVDTKALQEKGYSGGGMPGYGQMMGVEGGKEAEVKHEIPAIYADRKTSTIEVEVTPDGDNEFTIDLK